MEKTEILLADLREKTDLRETLSQIRKEIREGSTDIGRAIVADTCACEGIIDALAGTDAKTRKSAALLTGELPWTDDTRDIRNRLITALMRSYRNEDRLFVRESYLKTLLRLGGTGVLSDDDRLYLDDRLYDIDTQDIPTEDIGHIMAERRALVALTGPEDAGMPPMHYTAPDSFPVLMIPVRGFYAPLKSALHEMGLSSGYTSVGVLMQPSEFRQYRQLRLYAGIAYQIDGRFSGSADTVISDLQGSGIGTFLKSTMRQGDRCSVRIMVHEKKDRHSGTAKRFTDALLYLYRGVIINEAPYDLTLHFYPRKSGGYVLFIKSAHEKDDRFSYVKKRLSTSMRPVKAAIMIWLIRRYLKEDARVVDIFSGNGTLLLERDEYMRTHVMFATDTSEEAISAGKTDALAKNRNIYFVRRSAFTFETDEPFDEIISELPDLYDIGEQERESFYEQTAQATLRLLGSGGHAFYLASGNGIPTMIRRTEGLSFREEIPFDDKRTIYVIKRD